MKKFNSLALLSAVLVLAAGIARADSMKVAEAPAAPAAPTLSAGTGRVLKDNVNVRSRADKTSEVIAQLKKGDTVEVHDRKGEWLRISAPAGTKCYVAAKFIKDGAVTGDAINIRCGPGANYHDIGKLAKGTTVVVVETKGEWSQINPTADCHGWVAAELIEVAVPTPIPAPITTSEVLPAPTPAPTPAPMQMTDKSDDIVVQYIVKDGYLAIVKEANAPGQYALMTENISGREYIIAYLESTQTNLSRYDGKHVRITGNSRWKRKDRYPVIAIERCDPVL